MACMQTSRTHHTPWFPLPTHCGDDTSSPVLLKQETSLVQKHTGRTDGSRWVATWAGRVLWQWHSGQRNFRARPLHVKGVFCSGCTAFVSMLYSKDAAMETRTVVHGERQGALFASRCLLGSDCPSHRDSQRCCQSKRKKVRYHFTTVNCGNSVCFFGGP